MFKRRKNRPEEHKVEIESREPQEPFAVEADELVEGGSDTGDVYSDTASLLAECPNPFAGLVVVIEHLRRLDAVTEEELGMIGIDAEERAALQEAFENNNSIDELAEDVALAAHLRNYRNTIKEIAEEAGVVSESARENLRRNLAGFALDNDIEDLRLAYRLMRLERPELLG